MKTKTHLQHVTGWLMDLANLTAGTAPLADAKTKGEAYASMLADEFTDPRLFDRAALQAIAAACRFFPTYAELRGHLTVWWKEHRPADTGAPALGADDATLTADDRGWITNWHRHKANDFRAFKDERPLTPAEHLRQTRKFRPRAYAYLLRTDEQALQVATLNGWIEEDRPQGRTAEEIAHAEWVARDAIAAIREATRPRVPLASNPAHVAAAQARTVAADAATPPPKAHPLPDATLAAVRDANPMIAGTRAAQAAQRARDEPEDTPPAAREASAVVTGPWRAPWAEDDAA